MQTKTVFLLAGIVALVLISGCTLLGGSTNKTVAFGTPFTLKMNETAVIPSENFLLTFVGVTEDSRCPSDVACISEGQASVLVNAKSAGMGVPITLTLTGRGPNGEFGEENSAAFTGCTIKLVKIEPVKISTRQLSQADYTVTLLVSKP